MGECKTGHSKEAPGGVGCGQVQHTEALKHDMKERLIARPPLGWGRGAAYMQGGGVGGAAHIQGGCDGGDCHKATAGADQLPALY